MLWFWIGFALFILTMFALDLGVFRRKITEVRIKDSLIWTLIWISLAFVFNAGVYFGLGKEPALQFFTGYLIEYSLSIDNIFVFLLLFSYFKIPPRHQHKVLFWGILGALLMRALFIAVGIQLIHQFHWTIYVFGVFLVITGIKMAFEKDKKIDPGKNPILIFFKRFMPVANHYDGEKFFIRKESRLTATPLFVALLVVEITDVIFAVDSIPAVLAVTTDPFIVYTSNAFAILGLRSLYFVLAKFMEFFHHLHYGLSAVLTFVGLEMIFSDLYPIPIGISLSVIGGFLIVSILASLLWPKSHHA